MNNEKQRIAIAEACGWKMHDHPDCLAKKEGWVSRRWETWVMNPSGLLVFKHDIPNYLNDLNAMHQAEMVLSRGEHYNQTGGFGLYVQNLDFVRCGRKHLIEATAAERARAFLLTLGKWEEEA
jgi:hypothetical protein